MSTKEELIEQGYKIMKMMRLLLKSNVKLSMARYSLKKS